VISILLDTHTSSLHTGSICPKTLRFSAFLPSEVVAPDAAVEAAQKNSVGLFDLLAEDHIGVDFEQVFGLTRANVESLDLAVLGHTLQTAVVGFALEDVVDASAVDRA